MPTFIPQVKGWLEHCARQDAQRQSASRLPAMSKLYCPSVCAMVRRPGWLPVYWHQSAPPPGRTLVFSPTSKQQRLTLKKLRSAGCAASWATDPQSADQELFQCGRIRFNRLEGRFRVLQFPESGCTQISIRQDAPEHLRE